MRGRAAIMLGMALALVGAACSHPATSAVTSTPASSAPPVSPSPSAAAVSRTLSYGYYDAHLDSYVSTDVSSKSEAAATHINYSPGLVTLKATSFPSIYMVKGKAAANQLTVFGSQPGESDYSPLWDETVVTWKPGASPVLLTSDGQILGLAPRGSSRCVTPPRC